MPIPDLLDRLLRAPGPSGREESAAAIVREEARALGATVESDVLGATTAVVGAEGPLVALVAHVDQIGGAVSRIREDGLISVHKLAHSDPRATAYQRVRVLTANGELPGVVGVAAKDKDKPAWEDLYLDVGAADGDEARELVEHGDAFVLDAAPVELHGGRFASAAIDNRAAVWIGLETLRRAAAEELPCRLALVASVHEEVYGASSVAAPLRTLAPDAAITLDMTYSTDVPEGDADAGGAHSLGGGPALFRGTIIHPRLFALLREAADAADIPYTVETGMTTMTDADAFYAEGAGIPVALVSAPIRRMHTGVETAQLSDLEAVVDLLVAFAERLGPSLDLAR